MNTPLYPFQDTAIGQLLKKVALARQIDDPSRCISFTAPTGAGKTIMMTGFIEDVFSGTPDFAADPDAIFVWLSDSPELNKQTFDKMLLMSDKVNPSQLFVIENTFDAEELTAGTVYFLNTQKLAKDTKLVTKGDGRQYTIWETLANTGANRKQHLYVIIDEAHRGALKGTNNGLPIMQRFIKGSPSDGMVPMPIVIGVTATPKRFDNLIAGSPYGNEKVIVPIEDVKSSGLLKERILLHPQKTEIRADRALFENAVDEWVSVTKLWNDYCEEDEQFKPLLVVQVENEFAGSVTATDLAMCCDVIGQKLGRQLLPGEVVHTFPSAGPLVFSNGVIQEIEPSRIQDDANAIVVFFKENLSTGWDCPRAETLVSFRIALDETYIAQILGRMIRTPLRRRVESEPHLNDVSLFVPYFDDSNTQKLLKALEGELQIDAPNPKELVVCKRNPAYADVFVALASKPTYSIDKTKRQPYLRLAMDLATRLTLDGLAPGLIETVRKSMVDRLEGELQRMKSDGSYTAARASIMQVLMKTIVITNPTGGAQASQGQSSSGYISDYDADVAFDEAGRRLGSSVVMAYLVRRSAENRKDVKIDVIALSKDLPALNALESFAQASFTQNFSLHQVQIAALDEGKRAKYKRMVRSAAKPIACFLDNLPSSLEAFRNSDTSDYGGHVYCDANGNFPVKLTGWEAATLKHEQEQPNFYAWLRNYDRKPWSLAIPYEMGGLTLPMYPDFVVARKSGGTLVLDILEPHRDDASDNWSKAVGLAKYANNHAGAFGRILMIRVVSVAGVKALKAIDMADLATRNNVLSITTEAQLKAAFDSNGFILS